MLETANTESPESRRLVLGFDAGCSACSDLARRIEQRAGDRLAVRDLADPEVRRWRSEALGDNAPWSPTLLEVGGSGVRAWVGWRMGWALGRLLGPATTLRVIRALRAGVAQEAYALPDAVVPPAPAARGPNPLTLVRSREVTGEDLAATARRAAANVDVRNLAGAALSTAAQISAARPTAFVHTLRNGATVRAVVYRVSSTRILAHHLFSEPSGRKAPSLAKLWQIDGSRSVLVNASEGGRLWRDPNPRTRSRGIAPLACCPPEGIPASTEEPCTYRERVCAAINTSCVLGLAEAGAGCLLFFYTLPESALAVGPGYAACAGGYMGPRRSCCAEFRCATRPCNHAPPRP